MLSAIFDQCPTWDQLDVEKINVSDKLKAVTYEGQMLLVRTNLELRDSYYIVPCDVPDSLISRLQALNVRVKQDTSYYAGSITILDKHGTPFMQEYSTTVIDRLIGQAPCEALMRILLEDGSYCDSDDEEVNSDAEGELYVYTFEMLRFPTYTSPMERLSERIEYMEQILNMPKNLGSVQGWVQLMQENWEEVNAARKKDEGGETKIMLLKTCPCLSINLVAD